MPAALFSSVWAGDLDAGQSEIYLREQLRTYRNGRRSDEVMAVMAKPLSDADIENLAARYAAIEVTVKAPK